MSTQTPFQQKPFAFGQHDKDDKERKPLTSLFAKPQTLSSGAFSHHNDHAQPFASHTQEQPKPFSAFRQTQTQTQTQTRSFGTQTTKPASTFGTRQSSPFGSQNTTQTQTSLLAASARQLGRLQLRRHALLRLRQHGLFSGRAQAQARIRAQVAFIAPGPCICRHLPFTRK